MLPEMRSVEAPISTHPGAFLKAERCRDGSALITITSPNGQRLPLPINSEARGGIGWAFKDEETAPNVTFGKGTGSIPREAAANINRAGMALAGAFDWSKSPEDTAFWAAIARRLFGMASELNRGAPPAPAASPSVQFLPRPPRPVPDAVTFRCHVDNSDTVTASRGAERGIWIATRGKHGGREAVGLTLGQAAEMAKALARLATGGEMPGDDGVKFSCRYHPGARVGVQRGDKRRVWVYVQRGDYERSICLTPADAVAMAQTIAAMISAT